MKKNILALFLAGLVYSSFSQTEVLEFEYSPNGERVKREVIILDGKDYSKSLEMNNFETSEKTIVIYPNPVLKQLKVEMVGEFEQTDIKYEIYSLQGTQLLMGRIINNESINFEKLPPGTYILTLYIDNSKKTWKVIKS